MKKLFLALFLLFSLWSLKAQIKKFGKISKKDFVLKNADKYKDDDAVILFKERKSWYDYDQINGWQIVTQIHERRLLKNKDGFKYATKAIKLYGRNNDERVIIKAVTFNLVHGKIVKTKLNKKDIFKEKINRYWNEKKFTMPNLKEGSIIDWQYKIFSPYVENIDDVIYKIDIPILYLTAEIKIPEYFHFKYSTTNYFPVKVTQSESNLNINMQDKNRYANNIGNYETHYQNSHYDVKLNVYTLSLQDIAPISIEPYMNSINNYIGRVKFELSYIKYPNQIPKYIATSWADVCKTIYIKSNFGNQIKKQYYFKKDLAQIIKPTDTSVQKISKILNFIKNKIKWNKQYGIYADDGVVKAYKKGIGNVAEINFAFIAMLNASGIKAYPVLVSTNSHGTPLFPTIDGFNYVVTAVASGAGYILIDPTERFAIPGVLPKRVLNWQGRLVKEDGQSESIDLFPKFYSVATDIIQADLNTDLEIKGFDFKKYTGNIALHKRNQFENLSSEDLIKLFEDQYDGLTIDKIRKSSLYKLQKPFKIQMQFDMEDAVEEIGPKKSFNPALFLTEKENVFKSDKRDFPVYFGYPFMFSSTITIKVPPTYQIEKLPENVTYTLPENLGSFTYTISQNNNVIKLVIEQKINAPIIPNTQYSVLKDFMGKIVQKENEKVILKNK